MILPIPTNQSCLTKISNSLWKSGTQSDEIIQWVNKIKENFFRNLDYTKVHKNLNYNVDYDAWIFQGNKDDKILGSFKEFLSYPYDELQFDIGDYISFNYGGDIHDWLLTSIDKKLYYDIHGRIERCNIRLKWQDGCGNVYDYPAVAREELGRDLPDFKSAITINQGKLKLNVQFNEHTRLIPINKRFLFGDPDQAFKVIALINYTDTPILGLDMEIDNISPSDDLGLNIANYNSFKYNVDILEKDFEQMTEYETQLHYETRIDGIVENLPVIWSSSDSSIGTIDYQGNIKLIDIGTVVFRCSLEGNEFVNDSITVACSDTPIEIVDIIISPVLTELLQGQSQIFTCKKLVNNVISGEVLNILNTTTDVPSGYYSFSSVGGSNSFTVTNLRMPIGYGKVQITVSDNSSNQKIIEISLKGIY